MEKYFSREFQLTSNDVNLEILQHTVGDVGCVVWDAALVLGAYLDHMNQTGQIPVKNRRILELGSGTGFVGLVAAALGGDCLMTDLPEMVPLIKRNLFKNTPLLQGAGSAKAFEWGSDMSGLVSHTDKGFDIVLAADCIYYKESLNAFIKTIEDLSSHSNEGTKTEIFISYEDRESEEKKTLIADFFERIKKSCCVSKVPYEHYRNDFRCEDIHIFKITYLKT
ncbi:protein-lysine methyltransferase METTL21D isoform X1 [Daphnia magna]|uniref:protein-lysine methyltransferase METTL21D isoform X1 n=1 Tax=Daphnia magna TaxID=35525 RepID=UPI001E1BAB13|nr:protein-lysine methyltransferase METTL21D isoform X1 [Daphnia magna]